MLAWYPNRYIPRKGQSLLWSLGGASASLERLPFPTGYNGSYIPLTQDISYTEGEAAVVRGGDGKDCRVRLGGKDCAGKISEIS